MSKRTEQGVVLAIAAPHPDETKAAAGEQVTVYWEGPGKRWAELQRHAARFVDEALALHTLRTVSNPATLERQRVWSEPALHARNGGPTTPVITTPPAGTSLPEREETPEPVQGDLFAGTETSS